MTRALALVAVLGTSANAEITKFGELSLGQPASKSAIQKGTLLGCSGSFTQRVAKGKIIEVSFTPGRDCQVDPVEAQVSRAYGGAKPIVTADKMLKLWEGKTASVIIQYGVQAAIKLVLPGPGAKRTCFPADGFAAFWKDFTSAIANPAKAAAMFSFPIKDDDGKVRYKDAAALAAKWAELVDASDGKEITSGKLSPTCDLMIETYDLRLASSNVSFVAKRVAGRWKWVEINDIASG